MCCAHALLYSCKDATRRPAHVRLGLGAGASSALRADAVSADAGARTLMASTVMSSTFPPRQFLGYWLGLSPAAAHFFRSGSHQALLVLLARWAAAKPTVHGVTSVLLNEASLARLASMSAI